MHEQGKSIEETAKTLGVSKTRLYERGILQLPAKAPASPVDASLGQPTPAQVPGAKALQEAEAPPALPAPDPLAVVRRILAARNTGALRELEDGLQVHRAGGEVALAPWLARPLPSLEVGDPLDEMGGALGKLKALLAEQGPTSIRMPAIAQAMATLGKGIEQVRRGRPKPPSEDQVQAQLRALDEEAMVEIEQYVRQAEEAAARPRPGAPRGVCVTCAAPLAG